MITTGEALTTLEFSPLAHFQARMLRTFRSAVEDWDEMCSTLGPWELQHLVQDNNPTFREQHRIWVNELIKWGQLGQRAISYPGFPDQDLATRVNARICHLEDKLALWHGSISPEEEERILRRAFP